MEAASYIDKKRRSKLLHVQIQEHNLYFHFTVSNMITTKAFKNISIIEISLPTNIMIDIHQKKMFT